MDEVEDGVEAPPFVVLEEGKRLSRSSLWAMQRRFFETRGMGAWSEGHVPSFITSNTYIARSYARVVHGYLRDAMAWAEGGVDPAEPVYIVELGAGSGRLAFHFLHKMAEIMERSPLKGLDLRLVMTDFPESTVASWRANPKLRPFVESGRLDFARYDMERDGEIHLLESGVTLAPGTLRNPLIVLANYVFDGIPHDVFFLAGGKLQEGLVTLRGRGDMSDPDDPTLFERIDLDFEKKPFDGPYYGDPDFDVILDEYQERLSETVVLFPCSGLASIRALQKLGGGRMLLLTGDKGYSREETLLGHPAPALVAHGSFSLSVNYHAIGRFVRQLGGASFEPPHNQVSLLIAAYALGAPEGGLVETGLAYHDNIVAGGPDDFFGMIRRYSIVAKEMQLDELIGYLRLSGWDGNLFLGCSNEIRDKLGDAPPPLRRECYQALRAIWDHYLPIGDGVDLAFTIGTLLLRMDYYPEAVEFFERSLADQGEDVATLYNLVLCRMQMRQLDAALALAEQALKIDPNQDLVKELRIKLRAEIAQRKL